MYAAAASLLECKTRLAICWLVALVVRVMLAKAEVAVYVGNDVEFLSAFGDPAVTSILLFRNVTLNKHSGSWTPYAPLLRRTNVTIQSACGSTCRPEDIMTLDFAYLCDLVLLDTNVTVRLRSVLITRYKKVAQIGVGVQLFHGRPGAAVELADVLEWDPACPPRRLDAYMATIELSLPSSPFTARNITVLGDVCWRGNCYNWTQHHVNITVQVPPHLHAEILSEFGPDYGYHLFVINSTRFCTSYWPLDCLQQRTADECHLYYNELVLAQLQQPLPQHMQPLLIAVPAAVCGALLLAAAAALILLTRRRARTKPTISFADDLTDGPADDATQAIEDVESGRRATKTEFGRRLAASNHALSFSNGLTLQIQQRKGWQLLARHTNPSVKCLTTCIDDKIDLGVLLGAGSSGRVYRARWCSRDVAVKVLQHDAQTAAAVANEATLTMQFDNPFIVHAYHVVAWRQEAQRSTGSSHDSASVDASCTVNHSQPPSKRPSDAAAEAGAASAKYKAGPCNGGSMFDHKAMLMARCSDSATTVPPHCSTASDTDVEVDPVHSSCCNRAGTFATCMTSEWLPEREDSFGALPNLAQTWLIEEYCDRGTLLDAVQAGQLCTPEGKPDMAKVLTKLHNVASGMNYLHMRNVIHRDLKASNVLLKTAPMQPFGVVAKVADFGLSATLSPGQTHASTCTMGTISHAAPEVLLAGRQSPAADVFSFGIMMWEVVSGRAACTGTYYGEVFQRVAISGERLALDVDVQQAVGAQYAQLMQQCWAADPAQRPTFAHVCEELEQQLSPYTQRSSGGNADGAGAAAAAAGLQDVSQCQGFF